MDRRTNHDEWECGSNVIGNVARPELFRIPQKGHSGIILLSDDYWGRRIHFWKGRSAPCLKEKCLPCGAGNWPRPYWFIPIWSAKTNTRWILELTEAAAQDMARIKINNGHLRGIVIGAKRKGGRTNGKLIMREEPRNFPIEMMPVEFDVRPILKAMWEVNTRGWENETPRITDEERKRMEGTGGMEIFLDKSDALRKPKLSRSNGHRRSTDGTNGDQH